MDTRKNAIAVTKTRVQTVFELVRAGCIQWDGIGNGAGWICMATEAPARSLPSSIRFDEFLGTLAKVERFAVRYACTMANDSAKGQMAVDLWQRNCLTTEQGVVR